MSSNRLRAGGRPAAVALLASFLAGCYSYVPVSATDAPVGKSVRATISAAEAERIALVLNREDRTLEGNLLEKTPDGAIVIAVPSTLMIEASSTSRGYQRIAVPLRDLQLLERRELNRTRTAVVGGVATAVVAAAVLGAFSDNSSASGSDRPQSEHQRLPARRAPVVRLRLRLSP